MPVSTSFGRPLLIAIVSLGAACAGQLDPANPQEAAVRGAGCQPHACGPGDLPLPDVSTASYRSRTESRMRG